MPTLQSRGSGVRAFGSGERSIGPAARPRNVQYEAVRPASSGYTATPDPIGGGRFGRPQATAPTPAAAPAANAPAPAAQRTAPAAATDWRDAASNDWRDAFKQGSRPEKVGSGQTEVGNMFRAAVEAERWRSRLSGTAAEVKRVDKQEPYNQSLPADWACERLFGDLGPTEEDLEEEEEMLRAKRVIGLAWSVEMPVEVEKIDHLEDTLRRRLGELETASAHVGRAARAMLADCDPYRSGRVVRSAFVEVMGRKLNYDFPRRGDQPGSKDVLGALFARYDLARVGVVPADDFHAALVGGHREGRASGRVINAIGRLREGLEREAGGYDALRLEDERWYKAQQAGRFRTGCLPSGLFLEGLMRLAQRSNVALSDADLNCLVSAFEPPPGGPAPPAEVEPLFSFDEFKLALRGPGLSTARLQIVRQAYAALKDVDANKKAVKPEHLAARYDVSKHPAVEAGFLTEAEAAMAFLAPWKEMPLDDEVKFEEFADRYEWVSPLFLHDDDFEAMVQVAWRLHEKTKKTSPF